MTDPLSILAFWAAEPDEDYPEAKVATCPNDTLCDLPPKHDGNCAAVCLICNNWYNANILQKHFADHAEHDAAQHGDA